MGDQNHQKIKELISSYVDGELDETHKNTFAQSAKIMFSINSIKVSPKCLSLQSALITILFIYPEKACRKTSFWDDAPKERHQADRE